MTWLSSPWVPAVVLLVGAGLNATVGLQRSMPLAAPLATIPAEILGRRSSDVEVSAEEIRVAGVTNWLYRSYAADAEPGFTLYIGYYPEQRQGRTIHSPKNCLPGAGWEPMESRPMTVPRPAGAPVKANRFLIANRDQRALVYYWYQGRGRTGANEYRVKLDLVVDAAVRRRTEEALVRVVVPVANGVSLAGADSLAVAAASQISAELERILPPR